MRYLDSVFYEERKARFKKKRIKYRVKNDLRHNDVEKFACGKKKRIKYFGIYSFTENDKSYSISYLSTLSMPGKAFRLVTKSSSSSLS